MNTNRLNTFTAAIVSIVVVATIIMAFFLGQATAQPEIKYVTSAADCSAEHVEPARQIEIIEVVRTKVVYVDTCKVEPTSATITTLVVTDEPSVIQPSVGPTVAPTVQPTVVPSVEPTVQPTEQPVVQPADTCKGNPGNAKCVGNAGEKDDSFNPPPAGPGTKGRSDGDKGKNKDK